MIRRPPRSTLDRSSAASDVYKRQLLDRRFTELRETGFENIYTTYLDHLYKKGSTVKLKKGTRVFEASIEGVSPTGKLITQHAFREEFDFGEVELIF